MPAARKPALWPLVILFAALFVWGAWEATISPIASGEVYPPYSSLRTDPLGAKALYESLAELPGLQVSRSYKERASIDPGKVLLVLGVDSPSWAVSKKETLDEYEMLLDRGGRLVLAFVPAHPIRTPESTGALQKQWDVRPIFSEPSGDSAASDIPKQSALSFAAGPAWTVLESDGDRAEIVERALGRGTVVLIADGFPLSNQGLAETGAGDASPARSADLIAKILGPARSVVFDENHFGIAETGSVATLARKYRLEGALAVLLLVAALFIWRNASSFLPPPDSSREESTAGRDSREGLAALMRRSIPEKDLLAVCFAQWQRSGDPRGSEQTQYEVERAIELHSGRDPVEAYRAACRALARKK